MIIESDPSNPIHWVPLVERSLWRFHLYLNKIKILSSSIHVSFSLVRGSTNGVVDVLTKQRVDRAIPLEALIG